MKRVGFVLILLSLLSFSAFSQQTSNSSCLMENGGLMLVPMQEKTGMSSSADVFFNVEGAPVSSDFEILINGGRWSWRDLGGAAIEGAIWGGIGGAAAGGLGGAAAGAVGGAAQGAVGYAVKEGVKALKEVIVPEKMGKPHWRYPHDGD